jgi:hypothetical protein
LVQFFLKLRKKSKSVRGGPSKTSKNLIMVDLSNLPRGMLHDGMFKGHLTISCHDYFSFVPNGQNRSGMYPAHQMTLSIQFASASVSFGIQNCL